MAQEPHNQTTALRVVSDADHFTQEQLKLISDAIMKGANATEIAFFGEVCKRTRLDPFRKQIHAVKRWDSRERREVWSYQTSVDGFRAIASRTGQYAGSDEPVFDPKDESAPFPFKASVTVWKLVGGMRVPFSASARWAEYSQSNKDGKLTSLWQKMPYLMLGKCAESLALRKAFPEDLSGLHTDEEMQQADNPEQNHKPRFDLQSRQVETEVRPDPAPAEVPQTVEAEVVPVTPASGYPVPAEVARYVGGAWKALRSDGNQLGALKRGALANLRLAPPQELMAPIAASFIDEIRALLLSHDVTEEAFAESASQTVEGIEFPAELWMNPDIYPSLLQLAKDAP